MQLRRILLLFALVLGLSALVGSLAPPPEDDRNEGAAEAPVPTTPSAVPRRLEGGERIRFEAPAPGDESFTTRTRVVPSGSSLRVSVSVPVPGDVAIDGLGLRESASPLVPALFELLAEPEGRYSVLFLPVSGEPRLVGRLQFAPTAGSKPPSKGTFRVR